MTKDVARPRPRAVVLAVLMRRAWRHPLLVLHLVGIVMSRSGATAATVPVLFAYDMAVRPTVTSQIGTGPSSRPERSSIP